MFGCFCFKELFGLLMFFFGLCKDVFVWVLLWVFLFLGWWIMIDLFKWGFLFWCVFLRSFFVILFFELSYVGLSVMGLVIMFMFVFGLFLYFIFLMVVFFIFISDVFGMLRIDLCRVFNGEFFGIWVYSLVELWFKYWGLFWWIICVLLWLVCVDVVIRYLYCVYMGIKFCDCFSVFFGGWCEM